MTSFYVRTPSGFEIEYGTGGLVVDDDTWEVGEHHAQSIWGHKPPAEPLVPGILAPASSSRHEPASTVAEQLADELAAATRRGRRAAPPSRPRVEGAARGRHPPVAAARAVGRRRGPHPRVRRRRDGARRARTPRPAGSPASSACTRGSWRCSTSGPRSDVGRRPGDDAQLVVQPDRQGRAGRRRATASSGRWSFSSGCDHCRGVNLGAVVRAARSPTSARSSCCPASTASRTTGTSPGSRPPAARTSSSRRRSSPSTSPSRTSTTRGRGAPGPGAQRRRLYRLPLSVVFNMALARRSSGRREGSSTSGSTSRGIGSPAAGAWPTIRSRQRRLAEALWDLDAAVTVMRRDAQTMWAMAEARETPTMAQRARMRWNMNRGCERVAEACVDLYRAASGRTAFVDHPLHAPVPGPAGRARPRLPRARPAGQGGRRRAARRDRAGVRALTTERRRGLRSATPER